LERHMREMLQTYPALRGVQVLNDMGEYMMTSTRGGWLEDSPEMREAILDGIREWDAFSNSSPREGIVTVLDELYEPGSNVDVYVYSDDFAFGSIDSVIREVERRNLDPATGGWKMRIHSVAIPTYL